MQLLIGIGSIAVNWKQWLMGLKQGTIDLINTVLLPCDV